MKDPPGGAPYRALDHTGDIGFEVTAPSVSDLFERAARALFEQIADLDDVEERERREVSAAGEDLEELLVAFLGELVYLHETEGLVLCRARIRDGPGREVTAEVYGEPIDPGRHAITREIKAVTYHGVRVEDRDGLWTARVILDI